MIDNNLIINKLSVKHMVNPDIIKKLIDHTFNEIKASISDEDMPNVLVTNFGRFYPRAKQLERAIIVKWKIYEEKGFPDYTIERMNKFIRVYERVCKEENKVPREYIMYIKNKIVNNEYRRKEDN